MNIPVRQYVLNDITVLGIDDGPLHFPVDFFVGLENDTEKLAFFTDGAIPSVTRMFLANTGGRVVLIDGGWGKEYDTKGYTLEYLNQTGIQAEDVTDILITHMDIDHIAGLIYEGRAVYPNAVLHLAQLEHDARVVQGKDRQRSDVELARRVVSIYGDRLSFFQDGETVLPGISAKLSCGHTTGHAVFTLTSGNRKMSIYGDMIHADPLQFLFPRICSIYEVDPEQAVAWRNDFYRASSEDGRLIAGSHIPTIGRLEKLPEGGYRLIPAR